MKLRSLDLVWLALLAATAFTWWLGSGGEPGLGRAAMAAVVLGMARAGEDLLAGRRHGRTLVTI